MALQNPSKYVVKSQREAGGKFLDRITLFTIKLNIPQQYFIHCSTYSLSPLLDRSQNAVSIFMLYETAILVYMFWETGQWYMTPYYQYLCVGILLCHRSRSFCSYGYVQMNLLRECCWHKTPCYLVWNAAISPFSQTGDKVFGDAIPKFLNGIALSPQRNAYILMERIQAVPYQSYMLSTHSPLKPDTFVAELGVFGFFLGYVLLYCSKDFPN